MYRLNTFQVNQFEQHLIDTLNRKHGLKFSLFRLIDSKIKSAKTSTLIGLSALIVLPTMLLLSQYWQAIKFYVAFGVV